MSNFITIEEVKTIAFNGDVATSQIPENYIELAQEAHLRPALGDDFFDRLDTSDTLTTYEETLKAKLKKPLAFFVKFELLPHIGFKIDSGGIKINNAYQAEGVSDKQRDQVIKACLDTARKFFQIANRYMIKNKENLPYWIDSDAINERTATNDGGIIIPNRLK